jgi:hypothetical protein
MHRWLADVNPQHTLPGSAAGMLGIAERIASKASTGRRT